MPRRARELSAVEVRRLAEGLHAVGGVSGLNLQIGQSGAKSWILRLRFEGKRRELGLGPYPEVTLAMARENARVLADRIRRGEGAAVLAERRREPPGRTVAGTIEDWLKVKLQEIVGEKNKVRYRSVAA